MAELPKMTAKQKRFCDEYLIDCNATQAAIRAGYSPKTAQAIGSENLKKPVVKKYIDEHLEISHNDAVMSAEEVLMRLTEIARDKKERAGNTLKALELLGKRHKLFVDRVEQELNGGDVPVVIKFEGPLDDWSK
ncbi:terminase small subunit [Christensenella sp. MSJ-20]|uniref:terminase small subunit n=1 Tax=Christensenella sp. MSJ-20 TaxID=2841518 RepID=UPI0037BF8870